MNTKFQYDRISIAITTTCLIMRILAVHNSSTKTLVAKLEEPGWEADPRPIVDVEDEEDCINWTFECHVFVRNFIITRTDSDQGWNIPLRFRLYHAARERVPSFTSTTYRYMGELGERAPHSVTKGIVDPSVRVIQSFAFSNCEKMVSCKMGDNVTTIKHHAFMGCISMKVIKLSPAISLVEEGAFLDCKSIDALIFSSTLQEIRTFAFESCERLRLITISGVQSIGPNIFHDCHSLLATPGIVCQYTYDDLLSTTNDWQILQSVRDVHSSMPRLHNVCLSPFITTKMIHDCMEVNGGPCTAYDAVRSIHHNLNPLHILVMNPHAPVEVIMECFKINAQAVIECDDSEMTPIDYMIKYGNIQAMTKIVTAMVRKRFNDEE